MATRKMSKHKRCKTCGAIMRLAFIYGRPCYKHQFPLEKKICDNRKAKLSAEKSSV